MVLEDIERLRVQGFTVARRGYDQREVDKFIAALVEWFETDAAKDLGDLAVTRKLELVGKSTAQILLTTEKESEQLRAQAEEECSELISQAEAAAREARRAADEYAKQAREKADQDARQTREAASASAKRIAEEGERRRAQLETLIAELDAHRDDALGELERLRDELTATIGEHKSGPRSSTPKRGERDRSARAPETAAKP